MQPLNNNNLDPAPPGPVRPDDENRHPGCYDYWWTPEGRPLPNYHPPYVPPPGRVYAPQQAYRPPGYNPWVCRARLPAGLAIASFVVGLLSLIAFWASGIGIVLGILSVLFGIFALIRCSRGRGRGKDIAIIGIIFGGTGTVLSTYFFIHISNYFW